MRLTSSLAITRGADPRRGGQGGTVVTRFLVTLVVAVAFPATVPATALARHYRHHHHSHHARTHRVRIRRFGDPNTQVPSASPTSSDNAGTVESFSGGVLTIMLNDHSTVSGRVTNDTELECEPDMPSSSAHEDGDRGSGDRSGSGDDQAQNNQAGEDQNENNEPGEDQNEVENEGMQNCTTAALTPGTVVHEAELRISSSGAVWSKVELITAGTPTGDDD
jgi:hypothetical protein